MPPPIPPTEYAFPQGNQATGGMTKRELVATYLLTALVSHDPEPPEPEAISLCVKWADDLLKELNT
jgi:hypothetical protein